MERHSFRINCGNCAFPQNFHTRKLGEITVVCAVVVTYSCYITKKNIFVIDVFIIEFLSFFKKSSPVNFNLFSTVISNFNCFGLSFCPNF